MQASQQQQLRAKIYRYCSSVYVARPHLESFYYSPSLQFAIVRFLHRSIYLFKFNDALLFVCVAQEQTTTTTTTTRRKEILFAID